MWEACEILEHGSQQWNIDIMITIAFIFSLKIIPHCKNGKPTLNPKNRESHYNINYIK